MPIRVRLLRVMLMIALAPMLLVALDHHLSTVRLQRRITEVSFDRFLREAEQHLRRLIEDYARLVERDRDLIAMTLTAQAQEVEARLAAPPPKNPRVFLNVHYDQGDPLPEDIQTTPKYFRLESNRKKTPLPVSFREQVFVIAPGVNPQSPSVRDDIARMSTMPEVYARLYRLNPDMKTWMYTGLETGIHCSYPGHGGYPPDYDPRRRKWYLAAVEHPSSEPVWTIFPDATTRTVTMTCSRKVFRPDGELAGVTAIDVPLASILSEMRLPEEWKSSCRIFHAVAQPARPGAEAIRLTIFNQKSYEYRGQVWDRDVDFETLHSDDPSEMLAMLQDVAGGKTNVRRMKYRGQDMLWAYSVYGDGQLVSVVLVPYEKVTEDARRLNQVIRRATREALGLTGFILIWVILLVIVIAYRRSRLITEPIHLLAESAKKLAEGDFNVRVPLHTRDELEDLGRVFNGMGPALREREKMKESLALAMEVQQHLLPPAPPAVEGFEFAGACRYSDETGGDYYDFIELHEGGETRIALAVGDVTGHGIGAALLMASARAVLRSHAATHGDDLGKMFEDINVHLVRDTGETRFFTLFYGLLDPKGRTLRWISAGHDPAIWIHGATGRIEELSSDGMVLGVLEDVRYRGAGPITLSPGDVIAVGTDGIWEARNSAGEMFGRERMIDVLRTNAHRSADEIHQAVVEAVLAFHGWDSPQEDDITLLVLKAL